MTQPGMLGPGCTRSEEELTVGEGACGLLIVQKGLSVAAAVVRPLRGMLVD